MGHPVQTIVGNTVQTIWPCIVWLIFYEVVKQSETTDSSHISLQPPLRFHPVKFEVMHHFLD